MNLKKTRIDLRRNKSILQRIKYSAQLHKRLYTLSLAFILVLLSILYINISITILVIGMFFILITIFHLLIRLSAAIKPRSKSRFKLDETYEPLVSIHVACKNEPADIVNKTVKALTKLDYSNYEVIVIHSNNQVKENWMKIKQFVEDCGDNFIFVHLDTVAGFKAGALNHINKNHMSKSADVVAIVDCDYIVTPDFLSKTVGYFKNPKVGIVQAPQDYYNLNSNNIGLYYEYKSFFTLVMNQAQRFNLVNFTGTMGLIRANLLLDEELTWNEWCITEDTEAGTHINSLGYRGVYVDKSLGKGLMPFDYNSLARQRERWVYGNAQIIGKDLYSVMTNKAFTLKQKISFIAQLITWFQFELIIAILYLTTSLLIIFGPANEHAALMNGLLAGSLVVSIVGNLLYFTIGLRNETSVINRVKAFLAHYGLIYVMSSGWLQYILGYKLGFNVTNKVNSDDKLKLGHLSKELMVSIILLITIIVKMISNSITNFDIFAVTISIIVEISGVVYLNKSFKK